MIGRAGVLARRSVRVAAGTAARLLLVSTLAAAACSTTHVTSDYDRNASFSSFHRFMLITRPHPGAPNPLVLERTCAAIVGELTAKGFVPASDLAEADFAVDFTVGACDRLDVRSYPAPHGGPWMAAGWRANEVDVRTYQEGALSIDVFDVRGRKPVWHGSAKKELSPSDLEHSEATIRGAVSAVLVDFPPKQR